VIRGWTGITLFALVAIACAPARPTPPPAAPRTLRLATGPEGGVYEALGGALATAYSAGIAGVTVVPVNTAGSTANADGVQKSDYDVAFIQADALFDAYSRGTDDDLSPHSNLRALAVLHTDVLQIVTRRDGPIRHIADLAGRRVGVGLPGGHTEVSVKNVLDVHGWRACASNSSTSTKPTAAWPKARSTRTS
jgi:uncharacterized protein